MGNRVQISLFDLLEDPDMLAAAQGGKGGRKVSLFARKKKRKRWREIDPMNFEEIAEVLGISRQGARKIFLQAMQKIRVIIKSNPERYERLHCYLEELEAMHAKNAN